MTMPRLAALPGDEGGDVFVLLLHEVRALRSDIAALGAARQRGSVRAADGAALANLLPEIARSVGSRYEWTARELLAHAQLADAALLETITRTTGPLDRGTTRRLGRLLRRAHGIEIGGLAVERIGDGAGVAIWFLREHEPTKPTTVVAPTLDAASCSSRTNDRRGPA